MKILRVVVSSSPELEGSDFSATAKILLLENYCWQNVADFGRFQAQIDRNVLQSSSESAENVFKNYSKTSSCSFHLGNAFAVLRNLIFSIDTGNIPLAMNEAQSHINHKLQEAIHAVQSKAMESHQSIDCY